MSEMTGTEFRQLNDVLSGDQMSQLSIDLKTKLESHLKLKQTAIDNLKTQLSDITTNAEKKIYAIDRELQNSKSKLRMNEDFSDKLRNQLRETEELLQKSRHEYYEILECKDSLNYELNSFKERVKRLTEDKTDLTELLDRRQEEIQSLQNELKTVCSKLNTNKEGRLEATVKAEELQMKLTCVQHQEIRMTRERDLFNKQIHSLNEELNAKVNELFALRKDRAIQVIELQSLLDQKTEENTKISEENKHLKQVIDKKDKNIESLAQRISEIQHYSQQLEEDFQNELNAQSNLVDLHKQSNAELKKRNEELVETIEEMQKLLQSAKEAHNELEVAFNETQRRFGEQLNESIEQNSHLSKQLEDLKKTLAITTKEVEFERQYPLASNTKKLLGNDSSFTKIFNELVSTQQELENQKHENAILKERLNHMITEAEENSPLLHRKIQEHNRALQNISELQNQISVLMNDRELWLQEKDTILRISKQYEREINRFEIENRDLSRQIQALIKSVQEARGFRVSQEQDSLISSSENDVPPELITFRNIEELQCRNRELMNALRDAKEKFKRLESDKNDEQRAAIQRDLDEALIQLENLRTERRQQTEMVEALIKQRDVYKMLAANPDPTQLQKSPLASLAHRLFSSPNSVTAEEHNKLKASFDEIKSELEKLHEENDNKLKALTETNNKMKEELSNLKIECAKTSSELTFTSEKLEMFKTNAEQFQRENALLREKNTVLTQNNKKQDQSLTLIRQELLNANDKISRLEMNVENLKSERDMYRSNEVTLLQEKELLIRNQENQSKLITTLQTIQSGFNQSESESIRELKAQIVKLEKQNSLLRNKCQKDSEKHSETTQLLEKQLQQIQNKLSAELEKNMLTQKEVIDSKTKIKSLENELTAIRGELNAARARELTSHKTNIIPTVSSETIEANKALQSQLNTLREQYVEAQNEVKLLRDRLNASPSNSANTSPQIQSLPQNASNQNTIVQLKKVARKYKAQYDELKLEFDKLKESKETLTPQVIADPQTPELQQKVEELNAKIKTLEQQIVKLTTDLTQVTEERDAAKVQATEKEEKAKKIALQAKQRLAAISTEKSNILKEKEGLEKIIEEFRNKIKQLEQSLEESTLRMSTYRSQCDAKEVRHKKELTDALRQIQDLKTQQQQQKQSQQQTQQSSQSVSVSVGVSTASVQTSQSPNPVRHSVHPQPAATQPVRPLSTKSTPTASIRPLAVAPTLHRTGRAANVSARTATIATVQPTTEESAAHQSVPQAAVQPTQTVSQVTVVPPNSSSDHELVTSEADDQMEEFIASQPLSETSESQSLDVPYIEDRSQDREEAHSSVTSAVVRSEMTEPSTSTIRLDRNRDKICLKRTRMTIEEPNSQIDPKKIRTDVEQEVIGTQEEFKEREVSPQRHQMVVKDDGDDDDVIVIESDDSDDEQRDEQECDDNQDEEEEEEEDDEEEEEEDSHYDEENEEMVEGSEEIYENEGEDYEEDDGSHYDDEQNDVSDNNPEDSEVVGVMPEMSDTREEEVEEPQQESIAIEVSESTDPNVPTSSSAVTSIVTSTTETNPFIQIPTPIQRPGFNRQSFYLREAQQGSNYDEGDGIVPSTPTLFVPRRGDSFADALNSPRVPQSRFVFSSSIPENTPLSQLATETTLGVDDTRMDLSQFDDNNGRSVPTTPLANSPANNSVHSTVQSSEGDAEPNQSFSVDQNITETIIPTELEGEVSNTGAEDVLNPIGQSSVDTELIEADVGQSEGTVELTESEAQMRTTEDTEERGDEVVSHFPNESISSSTSVTTSTRGVPTARRGRSFGPQRTGLQRRPILPPTSPAPSTDMQGIRPPAPSTGPQQPNPSGIQSGRTIRLRYSKTFTRGNFRGRPNRPPRGSRGGYYNN